MNDNERVLDLEEYCSSPSLSLDTLREKLSHVSAIQTSSSHFLHELCLNENVTLDMVELALNFNPYAAYFCSNRYHGITYDSEDVDSYEAENEGGTHDSGSICSDRAYPIHVACANIRCPNSVVELLAKSNPTALGHLCILLEEYGIYTTYEDSVEGVPLHYYLSRTSNMDLDTIKTLINACPESLTTSGEEVKCFPIHVIVHNPKVGAFSNIVRYIIERNQSTLQMLDVYDQVPLHVACYNKFVTENVVGILVDGWQESTRQKDCHGTLPIHQLCENTELNETAKLNILRIIVDAYPDSVKIRNISKWLPIHIASTYQNPTFCKFLVDACPKSLKVGNSQGNLPFHLACGRGILDTVVFLFGACPESIYEKTKYGFYPLHLAVRTNNGECRIEVVQFLLRHDPACASEPVAFDNDLPGTNAQSFIGYLPLHLALYKGSANMSTVQVLFDVHPSAIYTKVRMGASGRREDPLGMARAYQYTETVTFLEQQLHDVSTSFSDNDGTPIHHALHNNATLGVIKLILEKCPASISAFDPNQNSPLHEACREGRCDVVNHLMDVKAGLVSERNRDKRLPFELLLEADCDRDGLEFTEAVWRLLVAYPETVFACCVRKISSMR